jgi:hypothetical protein
VVVGQTDPRTTTHRDCCGLKDGTRRGEQRRTRRGDDEKSDEKSDEKRDSLTCVISLRRGGELRRSGRPQFLPGRPQFLQCRLIHLWGTCRLSLWILLA